MKKIFLLLILFSSLAYGQRSILDRDSGTVYLKASVAATTYLAKTSNLSDIADAATARVNLGLSTTANQTSSQNKNFVTDAQLVVLGNTSGTNSGDNAANTTYANDYRAANFVAGTNYLSPSGNGGSLTGLTASQVGLGSVNNTSDAGKPISTATQTALDLKANITSQTLVTPVIGVATGTSLAVTGLITSNGTAGIGYATGAGGTVTQLTSKATGVTLNKVSGEITLNSAALAAATVVSFTLTNSTISATDILVLNHVTTGTRGAYTLNAQCAAGSAVIYVRNNSAGSLSEAIVIRFAVIKSVNN